jgi:hypothetical protein
MATNAPCLPRRQAATLGRPVCVLGLTGGVRHRTQYLAQPGMTLTGLVTEPLPPLRQSV